MNNSSSAEVEVVDEARRALNALRRMRMTAGLHAKADRREFLDRVMVEEESLAALAIERLLQLAGLELRAPRLDA